MQKKSLLAGLGLPLMLLPQSAAASSGSQLGAHLPLWSVIPFAALLLSIAVFPLVAEHWWESNRNKLIVALLLGVPTAIYVGLQDYHPVVHALAEYSAFIALLGALYVISGGLVLRGDIQATPAVNTLFLAIGAVLANLIGTTGAAMLLIRPVLRTNSQRAHTRHIPIFFIFIVANMGGMLTPLGDPPLFLGYLRGVPFFWTLALAPIWAFGLGVVLTIFFLWDRAAYKRESLQAQRLDRAEQVPLALVGTYNIVALAGVIGAVLMPLPWPAADLKTIALRAGVMLSMAVISMRITPKTLRQENGFTFHPISEVAALFIGIFLAMSPALAMLEARGSELGLSSPWQFFWATGILSSFLDNAPTYVSFLSLAQGLKMTPDIVGVPTLMLKAISAGAVFMGANSYIGNGPNFMVKAIADEAGLRMPSFFGYMAYSAIILVPVFVVVTMIFFPPW